LYGRFLNNAIVSAVKFNLNVDRYLKETGISKIRFKMDLDLIKAKDYIVKRKGKTQKFANDGSLWYHELHQRFYKTNHGYFGSNRKMYRYL